MQLAARIRPRDLEEFFSSVGKVHDVRLILDNKSHRSKGIAYVEFTTIDAVPLALGLSGQRLLGVPIIVQPSHAERNRIASAAAALKSSATGPMRLYVGSLHYNITEDMIRGIFEPFGKIDDLKLMKDHQTGRSAGYGFITYHNAEDAKKAMDQLNGFELAGRPMKVGNVTEHSSENSTGSYYDIDDMDRAGFGLGATGRIQLMAKLAEGTGMQIPPAAASVLNQSHLSAVAAAQPAVASPPLLAAAPPIATQCFMLSNMFDQASRQRAGPNWENELKDDIIGECSQHGGVVHIYVDRESEQGNVYVKCPTITSAVASVNALHGRFYAGKIITAAYVPLPNYHQLFPDAARAVAFVMPSASRVSTTGFFAGAM
jgi:RNA-binding protein 39